ncbi:hypothetical protein BDV59DRAFT_182163 [Aspergillus ambiguus]|uniref:uncharacterized protein n=1 Tax=Aspergillus ambiguus TaxID=176160 RepID=UPI003CCE125F
MDFLLVSYSVYPPKFTYAGLLLMNGILGNLASPSPCALVGISNWPMNEEGRWASRGNEDSGSSVPGRQV